MQDMTTNKQTKAKQPRFLQLDLLFNYGMIPRTWEDSSVPDQKTKLYGDDDPLDICELGKRPMFIGDVRKVKVLGSFCVADQGEMDWKVLALNCDEAEHKGINDLKTFHRKRPGIIEQIMNWFVVYKKYEGKRENSILFGAKLFDLDETFQLLKESHECYKELTTGKRKKKEPFWHNNTLLP